METLSEIPFFSGTDEAHLMQLAGMFEYHVVEEGTAVTKEGTWTEGKFFLLLHGRAVVQWREAKETIELTKGNYFGEMSLMVHMPQSATVVADNRCLMLAVSKKDFHAFLRLAPKLADKMRIHVKERFMKKLIAFSIPFFANLSARNDNALLPRCAPASLQRHPVTQVNRLPIRLLYFVVLIFQENDMMRFAQKCDVREIKKKEVVVREGELEDSVDGTGTGDRVFYVITDGELEVSRAVTGEPGKREHLAREDTLGRPSPLLIFTSP